MLKHPPSQHIDGRLSAATTGFPEGTKFPQEDILWPSPRKKQFEEAIRTYQSALQRLTRRSSYYNAVQLCRAHREVAYATYVLWHIEPSVNLQVIQTVAQALQLGVSGLREVGSFWFDAKRKSAHLEKMIRNSKERANAM
jgi:hypothetical protein